MRIDINVKPNTHAHINALVLTRAALRMVGDEAHIAHLASVMVYDMSTPMTLAFAKVVCRDGNRIASVLLSQPNDWLDDHKVWLAFTSLLEITLRDMGVTLFMVAPKSKP